MRMIVCAAALAAILIGSASGAARAQDYLSFADDAEEVAQVLTSVQSCKRLGYDVDDRPQVPDEITDIALRNAVKAGIDRDLAQRLMLDALRREQGDMDLLTRPPNYVDTRDEVVAWIRETMAFWDRRCTLLTHGELSARYVRLAEGQPAVFEAYVASAIRQIDEARGAQ